MELIEVIAKNLRELRLHEKLTQKEVAEKLGVVYQAYQSYELAVNLPPIDNLIKLADIYDLPLDDLVGRGIK